MLIYKISNIVNDKVYIGQTVQKLSDRWSDHIRPCKGQHKNRSAIASAIRKYGIDKFKIEQIDSAGTFESLSILEIHYIKKFNSLSPNGYNLELGGGNKRCHEESKIKISNTLKGRSFVHRYTGGNKMPRTQEQKAHLSSLIKGKPNVVLYKKVECIQTKIIYESVNATATAHNCNRVTISGLIKSGKISRQGFSFRLI